MKRRWMVGTGWWLFVWMAFMASCLLLCPSCGSRSSSLAEGSSMAVAKDAALAANEGYAAPPMQALAPAETAGAPGSPAPDSGAPLSLTPGAGPAQSINIDNWLMPKAYAAEAIPDARYLIRNGDLNLSVESFEQASKQVGDVASNHSGIVTDSSMQKYGDGSRTGWVKVRVPAEEFFATWEALKALGEVDNQQVTSQDVSTQYISTVSRLKVLQTEQDTLQNMLKEALEVQRTRGLGEAYSVLLQTQQRLSEVSYEIQNHEDSLAQLADQITNSTITVNLTEKTGYVADKWDWGYSETFANARQDLKLKWRGFVQGLIFFGVSGWTYLIPWVILCIIGWAIYQRVRLAHRNRSARQRPANGPSLRNDKTGAAVARVHHEQTPPPDDPPSK